MLAAWAGVARGATPDLVEMTLERILRWDIDSSGVNYNRTTGIYGFGDMTRLADGRIVAYHSPHGGEMPALYEIDPVTGAAALLVQSAAGAGDVVAMTPMAGGDLFGRDNTLNFIRINPATLAWSPVPITGPYRTESMNTGGMATSPAGNIYAWCSGFDVGPGVYAKLFRIDPVAGTATAIGGYEGLSVGVEAMAFTPDGRLFGFTADEVRPGLPLQSNSVYEFNLQTGLPTFVARRDELALVRGVVFLPEPAATAVAILIGAAALGRRGRKGRNKDCADDLARPGRKQD
jgi:hypothetical protein